MSLLGNLFGNLFGDSASEYEARGDEYAGVSNWRRACDEYEQALEKSPRESPAHRRLGAKLDQARSRSFDVLLEDIHSCIDMREYTYAREQLQIARRLAETSPQRSQLEECEERLNGAGRHAPRTPAAAQVVPREQTAATAGRSAAVPQDNPQRSVPAAARLAAPLVLDAESNRDQAFQKLLSHLPAQDVRARMALGEEYREAALHVAAGHPEQAVEPLQRLFMENRHKAFLLYDLAEVLVDVGRQHDAKELLAYRMEQAPEDWQAAYAMAKILWSEGAGHQALQIIEAAVQRYPRSGHLMAQWGVFLQKLGSRELALEKYYLALQLDSFDDPGLYHTIANLHLELGQKEKAARGYLKALELDPDRIGTMLDYAEFLLERERDARACLAILDTTFRALRKRAANRLYHVYASYLSSRAHMLLGEREMALLSITRSLEDNVQPWLTEKLEDQRQAVLAV
jgi:tetratricopeptide (TPR) repeat protein